MSGAFGWIRNDRTSVTDADHNKKSVVAPRGPAPKVSIPAPAPAPRVLAKAAAAMPTPDGLHAVTSTAPNVLIVVMDGTGSMNDWPQEIFKRLPLLHQGAVDYLGGSDTEILFIVMGDAKKDSRPIQVGRLGRGPELDGILASFNLSLCGGGGNNAESHELVAAYLCKQVNVSSARSVHTFFITDGPPFPQVNPQECRTHLGFEPNAEWRNTEAVFAALRRKMHVYAVLCATGTYDPAPIEARWRQLVGAEDVLKLDDHRRVVDVMLGTLAAVTGQIDKFTQDLRSRQLGTRFGAQNVKAVLQSIALVGRGTPSSPHVLPKRKTISLLPAPSNPDDTDH